MCTVYTHILQVGFMKVAKHALYLQSRLTSPTSKEDHPHTPHHATRTTTMALRRLCRRTPRGARCQVMNDGDDDDANEHDDADL